MTPSFDPSELNRIFLCQREAFQTDPAPDAAKRRDRLDRLHRMITRHAGKIAKAISADFGHRPVEETRMLELLPLLAAIRHARGHLARWMKPRRLPTPWPMRPARNQILRQPLGVIGVIAPWNAPLLLSLGPAVGALAAGNRVMIKPSDQAPRFAAFLRDMVEAYFPEEEMAVLTGGVEMGRSFSALPFDHLLFSGSSATGRDVAAAAAGSLTPVTLELGGKSPAILDVSADFPKATRRLARGKLLNAGQTSVAPDYVLVPRGYEDHVVDLLRRAVGRLYPRIVGNPDYCTIATDSHFARLLALLEDARAKGAELIEINPGRETPDPAERRLFPTLVLGATGDMRLMQEEIFGPILPILPYDTIEEVGASLARCDRPQALYWFGSDAAHRDRVLAGTVSGAVAINDCVWQAGQDTVPLGGVGVSGHGAYHGEWGFCAFSKEKPVFTQARWSPLALLSPPYGPVFRTVAALIRRLG
ncbi:MAG: coniferyl aldehyde dehydrogenase [Telmatospirillum sp.]|nr:coniferyl aldehyde dehydrogenase [Telmatospirillum sp.]